MATNNVNFKVKNGLDVGTTLTFNGNLGVGSSPSYGTAGQVLTSSGTGSAPTWSTPSSGSGLSASSYVAQGRLTADTSVTPNADLVIPFVDDFDPQNWWDATAKKFTPTVAGYYNVTLQVWWTIAAVSNNQNNIQIRKNGSTFVISQTQTLSGNGYSQNATKLVYLNGSTDYVDFTAYTGNSSAQSLQYGGNSTGQGTFFSAILVSSGNGTVTSVSMTTPTGLSISGSPVTTTGTLVLSLTAGYSIPTTTSQSNWDSAYSWGSHAAAGYLTTSSAASTYQPLNTNLTTISGVTNATGYLYNNGSGAFTYRTIAFGDLPTGTTSSTVAIGNHTHAGVYEPATSAFTGKTYNGLSLTAAATGFTIAGGTTSKTLTVNNTLALSGTDSTTMTFPSTSATIARTDAGQTFTGIQTMTSPSITTSLTTGSSSFDLLNTTATTINLGGAATTLNVGYSGTGASTTNISTGSTTTATTKTINIGTGGTTASTTNINLGAGTTFQTSTVNILGTLKLDGAGVRSTPVAGAMEYDTVAPYFTASTTYGRGVMPSMSLFKLGTTRNITDGTSNSSLFGKSLVVEGGRSYYFKVVVSGTKGTTSSFVRFLFDGGAGTATYTSTYYYGMGNNGTAPDTISGRFLSGSTQANVTLSSTGTTWGYVIEGTFSVTAGAGGNWTPSCNFSATTGATPTVLAGSYMYIYPISSTISGDISIGAWV